ncbi:hypothetical protein ACFXKJ_28755 [Kitasatospora indigofera]|uniref:hypothetical protein n=1 Tax=Kitasatospora indigofera TaxID=67307 RepID=UPI0036D03019
MAMAQPLDMADIAALQARTEANMRAAEEAAAAAEAARLAAEEIRQARQAGGSS